MKDKKTRKEWGILVEKFNKADVTLKYFCDAYGIKATSLSYWIKKSKKAIRDSLPKLVKISKPKNVEPKIPQSQSIESKIEILYKGIKLEISDDTDPAGILNIILAIKGI